MSHSRRLSTSPDDRDAERATARRTTRLVCALVFVVFCGAAQPAAAMPLEGYRMRVRMALTEIENLWLSVETWEGTGAEYHAKIAEVFAKVRRLVPAEEVVEWEGGRVRVNNSWLEAEGPKFERLPAQGAERGQLLARVEERLTALENRLDELGRQATAATTKEQEKARLEAILRRKEFDETPPEKSWLARLWDRIKNWLNNLFGGGSSVMPGQTSWLPLISIIVIFGLAAALLGYAAWKFLPYLARRRKRDKEAEKRRPRVILGEQLAPGQTAADILAEAEALARKGELRAAIRKGYIALLCELGDRKVITLAQHKTNHDYLRAVREQRPLLNEMQKLTASFENHWYGFAPATPDDWAAFRSGYQQTLKTASLLSEKT